MIDKERQAIENILKELETYKKIADEIKELRDTIQKEYEYAMEGFMKKQEYIINLKMTILKA